MSKTLVVSLFGGPGTGKSTCAAGVFAELKNRGVNAELVSEYIKKWAWRGIHPNQFDNLYIFGKQSHAESILYGKVDVVVTDSPILVSAYYEDKYHPTNRLVKPAALRFIELTAAQGVSRKNFWLVRRKAYNPAGRYQTEDQAKEIDSEMDQWLVDNKVPFEDIRVEDRRRAGLIADLVCGIL